MPFLLGIAIVVVGFAIVAGWINRKVEDADQRVKGHIADVDERVKGHIADGKEVAQKLTRDAPRRIVGAYLIAFCVLVSAGVIQHGLIRSASKRVEAPPFSAAAVAPDPPPVSAATGIVPTWSADDSTRGRHARKLFDRGLRKLRDDDEEEALASFLTAFASTSARAHPELVNNIAFILRRLDRTDEARAFEQQLSHFPMPVPIPPELRPTITRIVQKRTDSRRTRQAPAGGAASAIEPKDGDTAGVLDPYAK